AHNQSSDRASRHKQQVTHSQRSLQSSPLARVPSRAAPDRLRAPLRSPHHSAPLHLPNSTSAAMTEARLENNTRPTAKLNPAAKSFVFNTAAPVWTPPSAPAATVASPAPAPKLKAEAKPFPFVPSFTAPPAAPPVAQKKAEEAAHEPESEDIKDTIVSSVASVTETSTVTIETTETTTAVEQTDVVAEETDVTMTATTDITTTTTITTETETVVVEATTEVIVAAQETKTAAAAEAEQAVIGERIVYSIARLLELEPELCPVPPSVLGLPVAAETTGRASQTISAETTPVNGGSRGGGSLRRGDSSRSLTRSNSYNESGSGGRGGSTRRGGRGGRGHNPHDTAPALEDCAPLAINEATRWKPSHSKSRLDAAQEQDATAASLKEARALLNKLSIEKFKKLSNELIAVAVRHVDVLAGVIETIIQKAKMEWHFSTMYAELCTKMSRTQMPAVVTSDGEVVEDTHKLFRRLLLQRCEQEFLEAPSREGFELLSPDDLAEKELIIKRGVLGHTRFVGELFKLRMIKARIMHQCVVNLFGNTEHPDEEALECLVNLLTTIGQTFEANAVNDAERQAIAQYYANIKALAQDAARLSTRVRFMLQDLLELRKNKWVARRKEAKAMTIAEVHAEAKREADEKARASASTGGGGARLHRSQSMNAAIDKQRRPTVGSGGGASEAWKARAAGVSSGASSSSSVSASASTVDADGWETVASGKSQKMLKPRSNSDRFLPSPSASSAAVGRPPKSAMTATATRGAGSIQKDAMAAAAASSSRGGSRRDRDRTSSSSSSSIGGSFSALRRGNSMIDLGRPPVSSASLAKSASASSSESETEAKDTTTVTPTTTTTKSNKTATLSAEAFEKKVKSILDEYVAMRDLDEAVACFAELASATHHARIAAQSLNVGLEKGDKERAAVASFLAGLHERGVVSTEDIAGPLHDLLEFAEDMEIDIPLTLQYVAEMVAPSVASGAVPLVRVVASVQHLAPSGKAAKVVAKTLAGVGDEARAKQLADDAALDFLPLLADAQRTDEGVRAFLCDTKLEFLLSA
ncbi:hypothetical protein PybrP1_011857, partial [[Pythium] brassicae (nom. inval.)]